MESSGVQLDYALKPARRRKWGRRIFWLMLVAACAFATVKWWQVPYEWVHRWQLVREFNKVSEIVIPPNAVAYEDDPAEARKLIQDNGYSQALLSGTIALYAPKDWKSMRRRFLLSSVPYDISTLYIGTRERHGHKCIVVIDAVVVEGSATQDVRFVFRMILPGSMRAAPQHIVFATVGYDFLSGRNKDSPRLQIYTATTDPKDPNHWIIPCHLGGKLLNFDCWLDDKDDNASIQLRQ